MLTFAALAALPDADVLVVAMGAHDGGVIGHRGASHSLAVAVVIGLASALLARRLGWPFLRTAIACTLAVCSHGILDALGEGGRGIPLLWPFSEVRVMSPWRLLPDAPRGFKLLSRHGLFDVALEFLVFLPLTAFALWPARQPRPQLVVIDGEGGAVWGAARAQDRAPFEEREPPVRSTG
jgi:inner membrane protein